MTPGPRSERSASRLSPAPATRAALAALVCSLALPLTPAIAQAAATERVVVVPTGIGPDLGAGLGGVVEVVRAAGGRVLDRLPLIQGVTAELPVRATVPSSYAVVPDRALTLASEDDDPTGAGAGSTVRATLGLGPATGAEGRGVTVAVVDTGVADHPDLARVTHVDLTGEGPGDGYGHGTFIAGLIAGSGASSNGAYAGVAPGATVLDVRVARADGSTDLVTVLRGLQVAARADVDVLNLSLSSGSPLPHQVDPLHRALQALWARGVTVVVPSGNDAAEVSSPGTDPLLLTAGGLDESGTAARYDDQVATWSGRGPTPQGDAKPDLLAPGASVVSLRARRSVIDANHPEARVGRGYFTGSGTSFSTAVVAGAAAVVLAERDLTHDQVKALLTDTAYDTRGARSATGAGGLDLAAALASRPLSPSDAALRNAGESQVSEPPGDAATWSDLLDALDAGHRAAATSAWVRLSPAARSWAARHWAASSWGARTWAARHWADAAWASWGGEWAARNWAARNWAASSWGASSWGARNWADQEWAASSWGARNWADQEWAASSWGARNWATLDWSARNWSALHWSARNWSALSWS